MNSNLSIPPVPPDAEGERQRSAVLAVRAELAGIGRVALDLLRAVSALQRKIDTFAFVPENDRITEPRIAVVDDDEGSDLTVYAEEPTTKAVR